jgi:ferredoxin--NADP+ reductase
MFKVVAIRMIAPNVHLLTLEAPEVAASARAGQFVMIRPNEEGERIPLTLADWDPDLGTVTLVFLSVGRTTSELALLEAGDAIPTVAGPLGNPTEIDRYGTVLLVGGCYGIAGSYPIAKALREAGNRVITLIEARSSFLFYWQDRLREVSDRLLFLTRDGSEGTCGHIDQLPRILEELGEPIDRAYANGCTYIMKRTSDTTRPLEIPTFVALNPIMIDGTGMCGVCRVSVGGKTQFACVDGPDFDGHQVDWEELRQRRGMYAAEEVIPLRSSAAREPMHEHMQGRCHE